MKPVVYIANMRLPSERAHSGQIMRMCLAFARNGRQTKLYIPSRKTSIKEDPFEYYDVKPEFSIERVWSLDLFRYAWMPHIIAYWVHALTFTGSLLERVKELRKSVVFSRDPISSFVLSWCIQDLVYEVHDTPKKSWFNTWFMGRLPYIIATNSWKKDVLVNEFGVSPQKILVTHHGVDAEKFALALSKEEAKQVLKLDPQVVQIVYTGHLYDWKGVYTLARAAQLIPRHMNVLLVGGTEKDIGAMREFCQRERITNVTCVGFQKHERIPLYLAAADVLVIPTSARYTMGKFESSPLKLFEYMASGKPIIASDLPAIRDIVDESQVYFMKPDSASDCARVIQQVCAHPHTKRDAARQRVAQQTWEQRARTILNHIHA